MTGTVNNTLLSIDALRSYITGELLNDSSLSIEDDQDLLMSGLLDSLNVIRLASYIEQQCKFDIPPEDVILEHFGSLNQISDYMKTRL